jgi:Fibronectin type III domain
MTDRIGVTKASPSTSFWLEADLISQNQAGNFSTVRLYMRAANGPSGSTGSGFFNAGSQSISIDGIWGGHTRSQNPFLPSGYAQNQQRWRDGPFDINIGHDADGNLGAITLRMNLNYGSINETHTASLGGFPRIPKVPGATFNIDVDQETNTSLRYRFGGTTDGGSPIREYQAQASTSTSFSSPITLGSTGTTTFTGLQQGTTYYFRSRARNDIGWGPYSTTNAAGTGTTEGIPSAPRSLTATPSTTALGRIDLSWTAPLNTYGGITNYYIYRGGTQIASVNGSTTTYASTGNTQHASVSYTVRARNAYAQTIGAYSADSNTATATSPGVPSAPLNLSAIVSTTIPGRIDLDWDPPTTVGTGITRYRVYQSPDIELAAPTVSNYTVTGLDPGATYTFFVRAFNAIGDTTNTPSANSNNVTAQALGEPNAPTAPAATASAAVPGRLVLTWTPPGGTSSGYNVYQLISGAYVLVGQPVNPTFTIDGLTPGVSQSFTVSARNSYTDSIGTSGPVSVVFSGSPGSTATQTVPNITVSNTTNTVLSGTYPISALTANTLSYSRIGLNIANTVVPSGSGTLTNNTNTALSGTYTITTPGTSSIQYSKTTPNVAVGTSVGSGQINNNTNPIFNGSRIVTAADPGNKKVSYALTSANVTARAVGGQITNVTNASFNGEGFVVSSVTENTIQYPRTSANVAETDATGTAFNKTNELIYNGTYEVTEVPSYNTLVYSRLENPLDGQTATNLARNPSFRAVNTGSTFIRTNLYPRPSGIVERSAYVSVADSAAVQASPRPRILDGVSYASARLIDTGPADSSRLGVRIGGFTLTTPSTVSLDVYVPSGMGFTTSGSWIARDDPNNDSTAADLLSPLFVDFEHDKWSRVELYMAPKAGRTVTSVYFTPTGDPSNGSYFDVNCVMALEGDQRGAEFFDGSSDPSTGWAYAWAGTVNNSTSTASAVFTTTETNTATNPNAVAATGFLSNNGAIWTATRNVTVPALHPQRITTAASSNRSGTASSFSMSMYDIDSLGLGGSTRRVGAWFYSTAAGYRAQIRGNATSAVYTTLPQNTWTFVASAEDIPSGQYASAYVDKIDSSTADSADIAYITGVTAFTGSFTPTESIWGGRLPDGDFLFAWAGTANASNSLRRVATVSQHVASNSVIAHSTAWSSSGNTSVRIIPLNTGTNSYMNVENLNLISTGTLVPGKTYTVSAVARLTAPLTGALEVNARSIQYAETVGGRTFRSTAPNAAGEYRLTLTFDVVPGETNGSIRLYNGASRGNGVVWWDDLVIVEGEVAPEFFDGDTEDTDLIVYSWAGTKYQSSSTRSSVTLSSRTLLDPYGDSYRANSRGKLDILYRSGWAG